MTSSPELKDGEFTLGFRSQDHKTELWHRHGVAWHDAPLPRRWHRCRVQSYGYLNYFDRVERCACGAIRISLPGRGMGHWMDRNQTRKRGK